MPYVLADTEEAREHVKDVVNSTGMNHSLTSCPPFTRAMCNHAVYVEQEPDAPKD